MSIVALNKITICGLVSEKTQVLTELQKLGCLHLIALRPGSQDADATTASHAQEAYKAVRFLLSAPRKRRPVPRDPAFDMGETVRRTLDNQQRLRIATDSRDFLAHRIQELEPWGDFALPQRHQLAGLRLWFYRLPRNQSASLAKLAHPWQIVYQDHRHAYVVLIASEQPPADALPVARTHAGFRPLGVLRQQLEQAEIELDELHAERERLTRWLFLLTQNLASAEDQAALQSATTQTLDVDAIFAVQGWAPRGAVAAIQRLVTGRGLALFIEDPTPTDLPPTLLDTPAVIAGGQDLVRFFQTPGYRTWDPSAVVYFSFALFFAMILADAGYALILGGLLAFVWRALGKTDTGQRLRALALTTTGFSLIYGLLVGSYFGRPPAEHSLPAAVRLLDLSDFDGMLQLSIIIGAAHVVLANALIAYHRGPPLQSKLPPMGWIAVTCGALALWLGEAGNYPSVLRALGGLSLTVGVLLILLFSGTQAFSGRSAMRRLLAGLVGISQITKLFGDVMSYIRLFALGLASTSLALTFNDLSGQLIAQLPGAGLLLALIVLTFGHGLNLVLAVVSGLVHGLRLNFIEFFSWAILEEGYPFRAFSVHDGNRMMKSL
ncbi:MAG: V-type ATP synthase subunit I [Gammaproteobacteria bacterium]